MSPMERQNEFGKWVPAEPLEPSFGVRWEMACRFRRDTLGQPLARAVVSGWRDARAVDAAAAPASRKDGAR